MRLLELAAAGHPGLHLRLLLVQGHEGRWIRPRHDVDKNLNEANDDDNDQEGAQAHKEFHVGQVHLVDVGIDGAYDEGADGACVKDVVVGSDVTSVNVAAFSDTLLVITMLTNL